jgi:DUF4097 and DUF4098 domain-containing protein YvlB
MPVFETPEPISVTIELSVGDVRFTAADRADTVVEVRPSDASDESDVKAAEQTHVEYANGALLVRGPKSRVFDFSRKTRSVDVTIGLPAGSRLSLDAAVGDVSSAGPLGECRIKTSTGHVRLDQTGPLRLNTSGGHVTVDSVAGDAEIATGTGRIRVGEIDGAAIIKNSNGNTDIGAVSGDARIRAANGDISIVRATAGVDAKTANGSIRIAEVVRGTVVLATATGDLEIGVAEGTAAWLEVSTGYGRVRNQLAETSGPETSEETVKVRAHTSYGDVTVVRS